MEKRTIGLIAVFITTALCGLPGLAGLCFGSMALLGSVLPDTGVPQEDVTIVVGFSIMILGLSLIFIAIPIAIGIWIWWSQKTEKIIWDDLHIPDEDF